MVDILTRDHCVHLSPDECWRLYVQLGDDAPFVRNRLKVIRHGGGGAVSVSTSEERRQVLNALTGVKLGVDAPGLRALELALAPGH